MMTSGFGASGLLSVAVTKRAAGRPAGGGSRSDGGPLARLHQQRPDGVFRNLLRAAAPGVEYDRGLHRVRFRQLDHHRLQYPPGSPVDGHDPAGAGSRVPYSLDGPVLEQHLPQGYILPHLHVHACALRPGKSSATTATCRMVGPW